MTTVAKQYLEYVADILKNTMDTQEERWIRRRNSYAGLVRTAEDFMFSDPVIRT